MSDIISNNTLTTCFPQPIIERIEELNCLVKEFPESIPLPEAAKYLRMNPNSLRSSIESGMAPFGISWKKTLNGNSAFKIPTLTFYMWMTQCRGFSFNT